METPMPAGRPSEPVPVELEAEILAWIGAGKPLREYCRQDGKPSYRTVYDWLDKDSEFSSRFAHARDLGEDQISQECLEIADDDSKDLAGELGIPNAVAVNRAKLRIETRLKLLAKWNPKKYGDKIAHTGEDGGPVQFVFSHVKEEK
jgi:hypothetical protein